MVRVYALVTCLASGSYETVSYFLDPAAAAADALALSKSLPPGSYVLVQQLDVYPTSFMRSHLLRVDGQA